VHDVVLENDCERLCVSQEGIGGHAKRKQGNIEGLLRWFIIQRTRTYIITELQATTSSVCSNVSLLPVVSCMRFCVSLLCLPSNA
jgi:hypothetical protein